MGYLSDINNNKLTFCPHCNSTSICKYGFVRERQRYKCKDCGKTFTNYTNKPWSKSKISIEVWDKYLRLMDNKHTLAECARILCINIKTAFSMRHRILNSIEEQGSILQVEAGIIRRIYYENRKGNKNIEEPRKRYNLHFGVDILDNTFLDIDERSMSVQLVEDVMMKNVSDEAILHASNNRFINKAIGTRIKLDGVIKCLNVCREYSFYELWHVDFRGVATKYLYRYYTWYKKNTRVRECFYSRVI